MSGKPIRGTWFGRACWASLICVLAATSAARGDTLNLTPQRPDISATGVSVIYTAGDGHLVISGSPQFFKTTTGSHAFGGGVNSFTIDAFVNQTTGALKPGGTIEVTGSIPDYSASGSLLKGDLTAFDFNAVTAPMIFFEFTFKPTSGALTTASVPSEARFGSWGGVILSANSSNYTGTFGGGFQGAGGVADIFAPAPAAFPAGAALFAGVGVFGGTFCRRGTRRRLVAI